MQIGEVVAREEPELVDAFDSCHEHDLAKRAFLDAREQLTTSASMP
jgi:hypothetical protein